MLLITKKHSSRFKLQLANYYIQRNIFDCTSCILTFQFELTNSEKIEVMENDLIGFCSEEDVTPVSMRFGEHRTYFRAIENDEFPIVGRAYGFDSTSFPAAFSIAVSISDGKHEL